MKKIVLSEYGYKVWKTASGKTILTFRRNDKYATKENANYRFKTSSKEISKKPGFIANGKLYLENPGLKDSEEVYLFFKGSLG